MKKPSGKPAVASEAGGFDLAVVAGLAKIAAANDLSEVEVEREGMRIRVARERHTIAATHVLAAPPVAAAAAPVMAAAPNPLSRGSSRRRGRESRHGQVADGRHRLSAGRPPTPNPSSRSARR